jgi:hypothetical protein
MAFEVARAVQPAGSMICSTTRATTMWNAHVDADSHYNTLGWHESRDPDAFFSASICPSIRTYAPPASTRSDPLLPYETVSWTEGCNPNVLFDTAGYLAAYADVAAAHVTLRHHDLSRWAAYPGGSLSNLC